VNRKYIESHVTPREEKEEVGNEGSIGMTAVDDGFDEEGEDVTCVVHE